MQTNCLIRPAGRLALVSFVLFCYFRSGAQDPVAPADQSDTSPANRLIARIYNSGFPEAHDTYNGMGAASDGKIYYVLSSESIDVGAQMYSFEPRARNITYLGD